VLCPDQRDGKIAIIGWHEGLAGQLHALLHEEGYDVDCFVNETCAPLHIQPVPRQAQKFSYPEAGLFKGLPLITSDRWLSIIEERHVGMILIAVPDPKLRRNIFSAAHGRIRIASYAHSSALVFPEAKLGIGSILLAKAFIGYRAEIKNGVIVNTGANIDHHAVVEDFATIHPAATLCGNVSVGEWAIVGAGATVVQRIALGKRCFVGAGSLVRRDVSDDTMVVGNPARFHRRLKDG